MLCCALRLPVAYHCGHKVKYFNVRHSRQDQGEVPPLYYEFCGVRQAGGAATLKCVSFGKLLKLSWPQFSHL